MIHDTVSFSSSQYILVWCRPQWYFIYFCFVCVCVCLFCVQLQTLVNFRSRMVRLSRSFKMTVVAGSTWDVAPKKATSPCPMWKWCDACVCVASSVFVVAVVVEVVVNVVIVQPIYLHLIYHIFSIIYCSLLLCHSSLVTAFFVCFFCFFWNFYSSPSDITRHISLLFMSLHVLSCGSQVAKNNTFSSVTDWDHPVMT